VGAQRAEEQHGVGGRVAFDDGDDRIGRLCEVAGSNLDA
jgi:hypothetical protein